MPRDRRFGPYARTARRLLSSRGARYFTRAATTLYGQGQIAGRNAAKRARKSIRMGRSARTLGNCVSVGTNPFPPYRKLKLLSIAHSDTVVGNTTDAVSMVAQMALCQAAGAKLALNGTWLNETNGLINTGATGAFHQLETPHYFDLMSTLYTHYYVDWMRIQYIFTNVGNKEYSVYFKVFRAHEDENQTARGAAASEAGLERIRYTAGMKCIDLPPDESGVHPAKKTINIFMSRKGLVPKADWYAKQSTFERLCIETNDQTISDEMPVFRMWVYDTVTPATPVTAAQPLRVTARCTFGLTYKGLKTQTLEADDPDA